MTTRTTSRAPQRRKLVALALPVLLAAGITVASAPAASAADPVDGSRTSGDAMFPNVGNGGYDALDYDVNIAWTPDATQSGSTIAGMRPLGLIAWNSGLNWSPPPMLTRTML